MTASAFARFLAPWSYAREEAQRRLDELRRRDGDECRRCRRPLRFDLPSGHDQAAKVVPILTGAARGKAALENLCLTHHRCNAAGLDHTDEVTERIRRRSEAALLARPKKRRKAA